MKKVRIIKKDAYERNMEMLSSFMYSKIYKAIQSVDNEASK